MPITRMNDEGEEEVLYTQDELAQEQARASELESEVEKLKRLNDEKTKNFRKLNQMTEEERANLSQTEVEIKRQLEQLQEEKEALVKNLQDRDLAQTLTVKGNLFKNIAGDDEETNKKLQKAYDLINLPETTPEEISARVVAAANMARIEISTNDNHSNSPLSAFWAGDAPTRNPHAKTGKEDDYKNFVESDKAKAAFRAMGDKE